MRAVLNGMLHLTKVSSVLCPQRAAAGGALGASIKDDHQLNSSGVFEELCIFAVQTDLFKLDSSPGDGVFVLHTMSGIWRSHMATVPFKITVSAKQAKPYYPREPLLRLVLVASAGKNNSAPRGLQIA